MKEILDVCCGSKMFYFNKQDHRVLYNDIRTVDTQLSDGRRLVIHPDTNYDFRELPFEDGQFKLIIYDPPHLVRAGERSWLRAKYGVLPKDEDWKAYIKLGFNECWRCLSEGGTLIMKWSTNQIKAKDMLEAIEMQPLLGDKRGNKRWYIFFKGGLIDDYD